MILGTHKPDKVGGKDRTYGNPIEDITIIEIHHDAPGWEPRANIPYLWIFEGASKEEVGF